jgi:hypothetical protein
MESYTFSLQYVSQSHLPLFYLFLTPGPMIGTFTGPWAVKSSCTGWARRSHWAWRRAHNTYREMRFAGLEGWGGERRLVVVRPMDSRTGIPTFNPSPSI